LNNKLVNSLRFGKYFTPEIIEIAQTNTLLMDKNSTMELLQANGVSCAETFPINKETDTEDLWDKLLLTRKWVFKPAGGAAGIGVFGKLENGVTQKEIRKHVDELKSKELFPSRSQVQEFVSGETFGATAFIFQDGQFRIFEIHKQTINSSGRFTGGTWSPEIQEENLRAVTHLYKQLAGIKHPAIRGLICIDFIDGKIIEINPRLTASAPIAHILRMKQETKSFAGAGFNFRKIDLNTNVSVSGKQISDGTLKRLIDAMYRKYGVYVLPQGINPFGASRFIFVNDTTEKVQKEFLESLR
jgi:phosphoribosylamine-glycine ligase